VTTAKLSTTSGAILDMKGMAGLGMRHPRNRLQPWGTVGMRMGWREEFNKADISMDPPGYWWAVFGPSVVLSVLMSVIATGFTSIAQYG
jgi:hypothetical protein